MQTVTMELELNAAYYKEMAAQGQSRAELRQELKREIKDQVNEHSIGKILDGMIDLPVMPFECKIVVGKG